MALIRKQFTICNDNHSAGGEANVGGGGGARGAAVPSGTFTGEVISSSKQNLINILCLFFSRNFRIFGPKQLLHFCKLISN